MKNNILYIYGAGESGINFKQKYLSMLNKYSVVYFVDRDECKMGTVIDGISVISPNDVKEGDMIISNYIFDAVYYKFLKKENLNILGIYLEECGEIHDYKSACLIRKMSYHNEYGWKYEKEEWPTIVQSNIERYRTSSDLFASIGNVCFELSNICNYADVHKKCPISREKEKIIMPMGQINKIIDELALKDYAGRIEFSVYNEPLIDPRLFLLMEKVKNKLPKSKIMLTSNAFYFNETMLNELFEFGCDKLTVTAYGNKEFERLLSYEINAPYVVYYSHFDNRLDGYVERNEAILNKQCGCFLNYVGISCTGELYLCCLDYEKRFKLGNVFEQGLEVVLNNEKVKWYVDNLIEGKRNICNICKNCEFDGR